MFDSISSQIRRPSGVWEWNRPRHLLWNHEIYRKSRSDMSSNIDHRRKPSEKPFWSSRSSIWGGVSRPQLYPGGGGTFSARFRPPPLPSPESMPENCCKSAQIRGPNRLQNHFKTTSQEVLQTQCKSGSPFAGTMREESP